MHRGACTAPKKQGFVISDRGTIRRQAVVLSRGMAFSMLFGPRTVWGQQVLPHISPWELCSGGAGNPGFQVHKLITICLVLVTIHISVQPSWPWKHPSSLSNHHGPVSAATRNTSEPAIIVEAAACVVIASIQPHLASIVTSIRSPVRPRKSLPKREAKWIVLRGLVHLKGRAVRM